MVAATQKTITQTEYLTPTTNVGKNLSTLKRHVDLRKQTEKRFFEANSGKRPFSAYGKPADQNQSHTQEQQNNTKIDVHVAARAPN